MNKKFWLNKCIANSTILLFFELFHDYFIFTLYINADSVALENINLCDSYSYFRHTYIHPFRDEILTAIFILFI